MPCKQYRLIHKDGLRISEYVARTFDGVARNSHLRTDNYFYYSCLTGHFSKDNCPSYLEKANFEALKAGAIDHLTIMTSTFMEQLCARTFTKVHMHLNQILYLDSLSLYSYNEENQLLVWAKKVFVTWLPP